MAYILALELMAAAQGIDFRKEQLGQSAKLGRGTRTAYDLIRKHVPFLENDAIMYPHIEAVQGLVADGTLFRAINNALKEGG